jgi:hypothetical protein
MFSNILAIVFAMMALIATEFVDMNHLLLCLPVKMPLRLQAPCPSEDQSY